MSPLSAALLALLAAATSPPQSGGGGQAEASAAPRRYLVERVVLEGLSRTPESLVRRYLLVGQGDLLDEERVLLSRLRLAQRGWFSRVETRLERGSERGRVVLIFKFTERNTLLVSDLALGATAPQPIYGGFGLSQQSLLGMGMELSGAFVYGGKPPGLDAPDRFSLRGSFFDPDLRVGRMPPVILGLTVLWIHGEEFACVDPECSGYEGNYAGAPRLRYSRAGGEISFGIRPAPFERLIAGFRYERLGATAATGGPFIRPGASSLCALTGLYERDTRNDLFFPTEGSRLLGQITFGSRAFGGDYEYSRYLLQLETDFGMPRGHALRLSATAGAVQGEAPFFDRFYAADHAYFSIGPALGRALELNFSTDSRYDALLLVGGAEWGIPLWQDGAFFHRGYLALGARALWSAERPRAGRTAASRTPLSAEAALRLDTPVGMFNVSLGYALDVFL